MQTGADYRERKFDFLQALCVLLTVAYVLLYGHNSLTRGRAYSPDSMNYIDVARNLADGRGLVQSAMGYNHPRFLGTGDWPAPYVAQPPLFPTLLAGFSWFGVDIDDAALLIPAFSHAAILILAAALAARWGGVSAVLLVMACLSWYAPLRSSCWKAWSDPLATVLVMVVLWLVDRLQSGVRRNDVETDYPATRVMRIPAFGFVLGLLCGAAFATRYALAPLTPLVCAYALRYAGLRAGLATAAGAAGPWAAVLVHNKLACGALLPPRNPSLRGMLDVLTDAARVVFGSHLDLPWLDGIPAFLVCGLAVMAAVWIVLREGIALTRWAPAWLWGGVYTAFVIFQRYLSHFDDLSPRLLLPALIPVVVVWAVVVARRMTGLVAGILCAVAMGCATAREVSVHLFQPPVRMADRIAMSPRLVWVQGNTSSRDVIIGNDPLDVVFYLHRRQVISFSPQPYSQPPVYDALIRFLDTHRDRFDRAYLVFRDFDGGLEARWTAKFGPFIRDLLAGRVAAYPRIRRIGVLGDTHIFKISGPDERNLESSSRTVDPVPLGALPQQDLPLPESGGR